MKKTFFVIAFSLFISSKIGVASNLNTTKIQSFQLPTITLKANPKDSYNLSGGGQINENFIDDFFKGNGDITSLLKINPNIQFDNNQSSSRNPGEIDPANISINGALYYQNNFMLDGVSINNDLNPAFKNQNSATDVPGLSQRLDIDVSLIKSINVYDSNVSASYGGFEGGVVEAITKDPDKNFSAKISYQTTSSAMTKYHIGSLSQEDFNNSTTSSAEPVFVKQIIRANVNGYVSENLGLIASFTTTQSTIPLKHYNSKIYPNPPTKDQHRSIYNYFFKLTYNPIQNLFLEAIATYAPQDNQYFIMNTKDSDFNIQSGGIQATLKEKYIFSFGNWSNDLNFSNLSNNRKSKTNYYKSWFYSAEKNYSPVFGESSSEGSWGNIKENQMTLNFKSDFNFNEISLWHSSHNFNFGISIGYTNAYYQRIQDAYSGSQQTGILNVEDKCVENEFCSNSPSIRLNPKTKTFIKYAGGQFFKRLNVYEKGKINLDNLSYAAYIEDDMQIYKIHFRPGIRLDGDTYMDKITFAPRMAVRYEVFKNQYTSTNLIAGYNRYYGRNLFAYRLYDGRNALMKEYIRTSPLTDWKNATLITNKSNVKFSQLKVPYNDEFVAGISQNFWNFESNFKYVRRNGRDQITKVSANIAKLSITPDYDSICIGKTCLPRYSIYTNNGKSNSDIFTFNLSTTKPFEFLHTYHSFLMGIDFSIIKRDFENYIESMNKSQYEDTQILYDGKKILFSQLPASNFAKPWTGRFTTISQFPLTPFIFTWTNFFNYSSGFKNTVQTAYAKPTNKNQKLSQSGFDEYKTIYFRDSFSWDTHIGTEIKMSGKNKLFFNLDIYNLLDNINIIASNTYQLGRQFWIQIGYEY
ncbi:TonB-dependent receptor plug domain-containing protein [Helicobacter sp. 13S00477-4]|uniref:TonB-dependent receptor plug domain-containing protein n=1 Tax=Helicobacter sp. 13S00477-4 TaxID=1905759 RepID=UPI000BA65E8A|nr:TonB-dependent receptor plug domain-containing protein [Helicobacter sp. 13S00477-4]PAF52831.1 hypothetical protein BKH44_01230 [Helicobacter sp. 13S00477-4]